MKSWESQFDQEILAEQGVRTAEEIELWLSEYIANVVNKDRDDIDPELPFARYGLDSSAAISMVNSLEDWLGLSLDATLVYNFPTIAGLASRISMGE